MATRRVGGGAFDEGAQFFTVRSERFERLVEEWLEAGIVQEWTRGFADAEGTHNEDGHPRYRGSEGMSSIPEHFARGLDVRTGERDLEGAHRVRHAGVRGGSAAYGAGPAVAGARQVGQLRIARRGTPLAGKHLLCSLPHAPGAARRADRRTRAGRCPDQGRAAGLDLGQPAQRHLGGARHHDPGRTGVEPRALRGRRSTRHGLAPRVRRGTTGFRPSLQGRRNRPHPLAL